VKSVIQSLPLKLLPEGSRIESDKELNSEIADSHCIVVEHTSFQGCWRNIFGWMVSEVSKNLFYLSWRIPSQGILLTAEDLGGTIIRRGGHHTSMDTVSLSKNLETSRTKESEADTSCKFY